MPIPNKRGAEGGIGGNASKLAKVDGGSPCQLPGPH